MSTEPVSNRKKLRLNDAIDGFMVDFSRCFGRPWPLGIPAAVKFLKWADKCGVSPGELFQRGSGRTRKPEASVMWCCGKTDVTTQENYETWLTNHSLRRIKQRGGKEMTIGQILRGME